jgi:hypothetical protein
MFGVFAGLVTIATVAWFGLRNRMRVASHVVSAVVLAPMIKTCYPDDPMGLVYSVHVGMLFDSDISITDENVAKFQEFVDMGIASGRTHLPWTELTVLPYYRDVSIGLPVKVTIQYEYADGEGCRWKVWFDSDHHTDIPLPQSRLYCDPDEEKEATSNIKLCMVYKDGKYIKNVTEDARKLSGPFGDFHGHNKAPLDFILDKDDTPCHLFLGYDDGGVIFRHVEGTEKFLFGG